MLNLLERIAAGFWAVCARLVAGHLGNVCDVQVLTRRAEHAEALNAEGQRISGKHDHVAPVRATADAAELDEFDVGVIAVKANDLDVTAARLAGLSPGAAMMTIQNGIGA